MAKKVKPGNGKPLQPMRRWQIGYRTVFGIEHEGRPYAVDVRLLDAAAHLYTSGRQSAQSELPAAFPVQDGQIEVAASSYGVKRIHLVTEDGTAHQLTPAPHTAERWRADLHLRSPRLSRMIEAVAVIILLIGLVVAAPALLEWVCGLEAVDGRLGNFTSPISLPTWLSWTVTGAGLVAAFERAFMLRSHWLLDLETNCVP
ncbi:hypothetical protein ACMYYO_14105 [Dermacoccaceae bacterium W4C1]